MISGFTRRFGPVPRTILSDRFFPGLGTPGSPRGDLLKLLALLAGRMSGLLVPSAISSDSGIPRTTLVRYLELLSSVFLIKTIPAWSSGQTSRATGTPKLAFTEVDASSRHPTAASSVLR